MGNPQSVLIVDDEPNILLSLQFLMKKSGYEVRTAKDGEEALAEISRAAPDLVLLDVMMPKIDGFSVCERIRSNPEWNNMRIIMLTARGRDVEREKGLALGADDYITKPFSTQEAIAQVEAVLDRFRNGEAPPHTLPRCRGFNARPSRTREFLTALFLLGVLLFAPPLLIVFNEPIRILGIPLLYFYLFAVWTGLIALVAQWWSIGMPRRRTTMPVRMCRQETTAKARGTPADAQRPDHHQRRLAVPLPPVRDCILRRQASGQRPQLDR